MYGKTILEFNPLARKEKEPYLTETFDTDMNISWKNFLEIAKRLGFEAGMVKPFVAKYTHAGEQHEEEILFFHKGKGLVLYATSYELQRVNTAKVYGQVKVKDRLTSKQCEVLHCFSWATGNVKVDLDVRTGFCSKLNAISGLNFRSQWDNEPFLWFLNYTEEKTMSKQHQEISRKKAMSVPEIAHIIYGV